MTSPAARIQGGFSIVTAVFLIVILGLLSVFIVAVFGLQQTSVKLDVLGARAYQAARTGIEWGAYQTLRSNACSGTTLTFAGTSLEGFSTTVTCTRTTADEGGTDVSIDRYVSTACNRPSCPAAPTENYVERQLSIVVSRAAP